MSRITTDQHATKWLAIAILLLGCQCLGAQDPQPDFPYGGLVIAENALVFSGPDAVHYATAELPQDSLVQVHRHDPNGWCAIRPPAGSFSLVPETAVQRLENNVGRMLEDGVQAWVGTRLGAVDRPLWQVKLRRDELVEILGEVSWPNPEGYSTIWYQIAPPAGEFRWIRISDLRLPSNVTDLPEVAPDPLPKATGSATPIGVNVTSDDDRPSPIRPSNYLQQISDPVMSDPQFADSEPDGPSLNPPSENEETVNRGWRQARRPIRVADNRYQLDRAEPFKTPALDAPVIGALPIAAAPPPAGDGSSANSHTGSLAATSPASDLIPIAPISGPVSDRIRKLDSQLTEEMRNPPAQWNLESILKQATSISASTNDVREREHAQRLQQKIRNCVSIQTRYGDAFSNKLPQPLSTPQTTVSDIQLDTTYDAHGWLNQLVRDNGRMSPTYVLEDENGKITHHIAPSPGLNLQHYMKQKVGVIGRRGFHRNLGLDHVTAERIVVLNKLR